jgi:hypothetical protein
MTELSYQILLFVSLTAGAFSLVLALLGREPSWWSVGSAALTELALLGQLVFSIVLVSSGASATGDTVEYFGYIITALLVPVGSVVWAVFERTKWSTLVIGLASFTVAVMVVRMWQIWSGNVPHF